MSGMDDRLNRIKLGWLKVSTHSNLTDPKVLRCWGSYMQHYSSVCSDWSKIWTAIALISYVIVDVNWTKAASHCSDFELLNLGISKECLPHARIEPPGRHICKSSLMRLSSLNLPEHLLPLSISLSGSFFQCCNFLIFLHVVHERWFNTIQYAQPPLPHAICSQ